MKELRDKLPRLPCFFFLFLSLPREEWGFPFPRPDNCTHYMSKRIIFPTVYRLETHNGTGGIIGWRHVIETA